MNKYSIYEARKVVKIMPRFDRTGPFGTGPMTGRGFGPGGFGMGWRHHGHHRGLGRYFGWGGPADPKEARQALAEYKQALKEELEDVEKEEKELATEK